MLESERANLVKERERKNNEIRMMHLELLKL